MQLLDNWRTLFSAWSVQIWSFTTFLEVAQQLVPLLDPYIPWWATVLLMLAGIGARFIKQPVATEAPDADK
jgi:hypothetical protein